MSKKIFFYLSVAGLLMADQLSKKASLHFLSEGQSVPVVPGVFHLTGVLNTGAAFGLLRGAGAFLVGVTAVLTVLISSYVLIKWDHLGALQRWGWSMVVGGALGNLYDRVFYGHVVDFLDFRIWPVFNLADSFVCAGVFMIFLSLIKK